MAAGGWASCLKMVDRRGYAPRTAGCKPADFLTNLAAHLKVARRLGAAPSPRSFGDSAAQAGARRVFENWCGQPELHRHPLIGTQASCS